MAIVDGRCKAEFLQLDEATNRGKKMVFYRPTTSGLKTPSVAHLLYRAVILLDLPMPGMSFGEVFLTKRRGLPSLGRALA